MATGLSISTQHDRARASASSVRAWAHEYVPLSTVVLPWIVARVIVVVAMRLPAQPASLRFGRLTLLDGQWFQQIATRWYDGPYTPGLWSSYPFFPALPDARRRARQARRARAVLAGRHLLAGLARRHRRRPPAGRPAPAGEHGTVGDVVPGAGARRRHDGDGLLRRPVPRRRGVGARARRGPALVGGRAARRGRHRQPAERLDRRRRRRRHRPRRPRRVAGARRRRRARRRPSWSAGAGTCGPSPAIRSSSTTPSRRGTR